MNCACGQARPEGAKFCPECGVAFAPRCASCGAELTPAAKFCAECGVATKGVGGSGAGKEISSQPIPDRRPTPSGLQAAAPTPGSARKVVTILFADLAGSTALHEGLDPESVNAFMERYYLAMRGAVEAHGGTVVKFLGDGVMVAFGVPRVAEDDAMRAVRAGVAMQQAFEDLAQRASAAIGLRVAINTGEVIVNPDNTDVLGDPVNVAARLQQEARNGDVVLGESTQRLVSALVTLAPLGSVTLKGRAEAVKAYRVESLERPAGVIAGPFVGRAAELARLEAAYAAAVEKPATGLAVLLGSPGLGKSRLIDELKRRLGETTTVLTAYCDAAGGATFAPIAAALREVLSALPADEGSETAASSDPLRLALEAVVPEGADRARIVAGIAALLAGSPASPEETFFVVRRMLAALAQAKPVVLVIDDLHWAEPLLLDLVEHLVQWGSGVPLLVLVGARPELRDVRSSLVTPGGLVGDVLTLAGLDAGAAMRLAANVIGAEDLPAAVAAKVLATSEGNPLFVGELVRMLVQEGGLTKEGERWVPGVALAALEMPPTIHALLAARIERLRPEERSVLERAAVVGRHFSRSAVAELMPSDAVDLDARLEALRRSELIEPDSGWFLGEPVLRFHHVLIRDAAYRRLLKGTRADLHARFADWVATRAGDADHDETIGWHLEQAHQLLRELGPLDTAGRSLGERAAQHLAAAGRRALARDDLPVAADLLGRAIDRLDADDTARADLALDWCEALLSAGDVGAAAKAIDELARFAGSGIGVQGSGSSEEGPHGSAGFPSQSETEPRTPNPEPREAGRSGRLRAWHTCFAAQLTVLTAPQDLQTAADSVAAAAQQLAALGDAGGEAKAHSVHATALARLGKVGACEAALDQALGAARRGGDRRRANAVLAGAPLAALWGPSPVTRASGRCLDVVRVLRITQGAPAVESVALSCQGVLEALRGRTEAARRMLASSRKMVEELGIAHRLFEADVFAGRIASMEGDAATAERLLRGAYDGLRDLGLGIDAARAGALLARTLLSLDRIDEAEALSHESEALAGDDLQAAIAWRGVRAEALAQRGEHVAAIELAKAAVAIASATDALLDHADARVALAVALRAAGQGAEADAEERRAIELWEAKGATLLVERACRSPIPESREDGVPAEPRYDRAPAHSAAGSGGGPPQGMSAARVPTKRHRVRPNLATAMQDRFDAALAARDFDAVAAVFREDLREIDHPTGSTYGRDACIASLQRLFRSHDAHYEVERLAALGELLLLVRRRVGAAGVTSARYDVGAYENEALQFFEVDARGRCCRAEVFAADRLGEVIKRLYERYAELLPDTPSRGRSGAQAGLERERAAATARSFGTMLTQPRDIDRVAAVIAPDFESVDHRHLSTWSMRGGAAFVEHLRALLEVAADVVIGTSEVLALEPSALLIRRMHSGTERLGGGAYERPFLVLFASDADGRLGRAEWFDAEREAEALARFDVLVASAEPRHPVRRRVRANAATRQLEREWAAVEARDVDALTALSSGVEVIHHPTGATYGATEVVRLHRELWRGANLDMKQEILATLGDSLALMRRTASHDGVEAKFGSVGPVEVEYVGVVEVDERNQAKHSEIFAADRLHTATARLYERYAELLPGGPARERAAATARSVAVWNGPIDPERLATAMASSVENADHRRFGTWSARGPEDYLRHWRLQDELAAGWALRDDDVLAIEPNAFLVRRAYFGTVRSTGGAFENLVLALFVFGSDGLTTRTEIWEPDCEAEALARFDELVGRDPSVSALGNGRIEEGFPSEPFVNAASQSASELFRCFNGRDWEGVLACVAPVMVFDERRRLVRNACDRDVWLEQFRFLFDVPKSRFTSHLRATRGERLALNFHRFEGEVAEGGGPLAIEDHFALHEVDADGRIVGIVLFDLEVEDAAHAELDARFAAGEGALHPRASAWVREFQRAFAAHDWEAMAALHAPDQIAVNHRTVGWGTLRGPGAWVPTLQTLVELAADAQFRLDHLRTCERGILWQSAWQGTRDGGPFETPLLVATELDDLGRQIRMDVWDADVFEPARARFEEMSAGGALARRAELAAPSRAEPHLENTASRAWREVIAAWRGRDLERFAALQPGLRRYRDHRRLFQLDLDREGFLEFTRPLLTMRSASAELELLATRGERLALMRFTLEMEDEVVGPSAIDSLLLIETDEQGAIVAYDRYEIDDQEAARVELEARWEAGEGAARRGPLAAIAKSNLATVFMERAWAAFDELDLDAAQEALDAVRTRFSADFVWEDRRPIVGLSGGLDLMLASARERLASGARHQRRTIVGTAGDRVAVGRILWAGGPPDGRFEVEFLAMHEVNEAGLCTAVIFFDPDDERAARREAWARWAAIDPVAAPWVELLAEITDAWNSRDRPRLRARFADDVVVEDHRHAGLGRIEGADAYIDSNVVLWELAPDQRLDFGWSWPVVDRHGLVVTLRREGTLADGGAFESEYVWLGLARGGRVTRAELFEIGAIDRALARLEELRPPSPRLRRTSPDPPSLLELRGTSPLRIPANAATRTWDRWCETGTAGNWEAHRAIHQPSYRVDDRRRLLRMVIDLEAAVVNDQHVFGEGWRPSQTLLATAGEHLALRHILWTTGGAGAASEVEMLSLDEVDTEERFVWTALFDPDDRAAAEAELFERYAAGGGDGMPRGMTEYFRGVNGGDLARARTGLCDDFVLEDRRRTGMGRLEGGDAYIASVAAAHELTGELHVRPLYAAAIAPHGRVVMIRAAGTNTEGGAFESYCAALVLYRDERIASFEFFEPEELDVALARLAECGA